MSQVRFTDPKLGTIYNWLINPPYDGVAQPAQKQREITRTSNTGNVGATDQQGDDGPYIMDWSVNVYHASQQQALWHWYQLCKTQTIYLTDWLGNQFEGQITGLGDQWIGAIAGPGDTTARLGYSKMTFQFRVYRFISGVMAAAGVTP